jgi:nucleoside-diphosphate-sugar epimerase
MILVTGGTGMVGAHLLYRLIKQGHRVRAIKRKTSNNGIVKKIFSYYSDEFETLFSKIDWFDADILDNEKIYHAMQGIESVFHAAAMVSFNPADRDRMIENNVKGTTILVNAALENKVKGFCHVSSIAALGAADKEKMINENTFRNPRAKYSGYSISKYYSELEVWRGITEGLPAFIINPSVILGPGNWESGSPSFFLNVHKGMKFYPPGMKGFVDVIDVVNAMILLMEKKTIGERYIVSSENLSFKDVFNKIAEILEVPKPKHVAGPFLLGVAWRMEYLKYILTGKDPLLTKNSAASGLKIDKYSNEKIKKELDYNFNSIDECIKRIGKNYLSDIKS